MSGRALFLDRDGTLVHPYHYPSRPEHLRLFDGVVPELQRLQQAGWHIVLITNQSGIARGFFTEDDLHRMHDSLQDELLRLGVRIDAIYYCPHHPKGAVPEFTRDCDCRKPGSGMLLQAATDLNIDIATSWFLGDILDDVEAGYQAGCQTVLVDLGTEALPDRPERTPDFVARDTKHALRIVRAAEGLGPETERNYLPDSWIARGTPASDLPAGSRSF